MVSGQAQGSLLTYRAHFHLLAGDLSVRAGWSQ